MKFLQVILITLSLFVFVPLLVVESSSSSDNNVVSNITRGSSLSSGDASPYWLSPSGNIAFGFYQLPWYPDRYLVGIWFIKSSEKTLVWKANPKNPTFQRPSSIFFTDEGKLILRTDNKDKLLLPNVPEPVAYAKMQDDGDFVLYGSDNQIVWESFDYPTNTLLGGQKLKAGVDLIYDDYRLSVKRANGFVAIYKNTILNPAGDGIGDITAESVSVMSDALDHDPFIRPAILILDITGKLYLGGSDDKVVKVFYQHKSKQQAKEVGDYMYRATLSYFGRLNLYKERIDGNQSHENQTESSSSIVWSSSNKEEITSDDVKVMLPTTIIVMSFLTTGVTLLVGLLMS